METMYVLWNYDVDEPIMASTDESLLEEFMCDIFMKDYQDMCNWDIYDKTNAPTDEMIHYIADDEWDNNDGNNYIFNIEHPETALIVLEDLKPARRLRRSYIWSKKVKHAIYKILVSIPKIITGNYRKKLEN